MSSRLSLSCRCVANRVFLRCRIISVKSERLFWSISSRCLASDVWIHTDSSGVCVGVGKRAFVCQSVRFICLCSWAKANSRCEIMVRSYFEVSRCDAIKALQDTKASLLYHSYHPSNLYQDADIKPDSWDDGSEDTDFINCSHLAYLARIFQKLPLPHGPVVEKMCPKMPSSRAKAHGQVPFSLGNHPNLPL